MSVVASPYDTCAVKSGAVELMRNVMMCLLFDDAIVACRTLSLNEARANCC